MAIPFLLSAATRLVTSQMAKKAAKEGVKRAAKKFVKGKKKDKVKSKGGALVKRAEVSQGKTQQRVSYQKLLNTSKDVGSVDKIQQNISYESLTKTMQGIVKTTTQLDKTLKKQLLVDKKKADNKKKLTSAKKKKQREENLEKRRLNLGGIGSAAMGVANKFNIIDFFTNILLGGLILWMINNVDKMKSAFKLLENNIYASFLILRGGLRAIKGVLKFAIKAPFRLVATVGRTIGKIAGGILKGIRSLGKAILRFAGNQLRRLRGLPPIDDPKSKGSKRPTGAGTGTYRRPGTSGFRGPGRYRLPGQAAAGGFELEQARKKASEFKPTPKRGPLGRLDGVRRRFGAGLETGTAFGGKGSKLQRSTVGTFRKGKKVAQTTNSFLKNLLGIGGAKDIARLKTASPVLKKASNFMKGARIPVVGPMIVFTMTALDPDPETGGIGRAAFKAIGAGLGEFLGFGIPIPVLGPIIGGLLGEVMGDVAYELIVNKSPKAAGAKIMNAVGAVAKVGGQILDWMKGVVGRFWEALPKLKLPEKIGPFSLPFGLGGMEILDPKMFMGPYGLLGAFGTMGKAMVTAIFQPDKEEKGKVDDKSKTKDDDKSKTKENEITSTTDGASPASPGPMGGTPSQQQAFKQVYDIAARVGGANFPEVVAAQAMHETGYLANPNSVYFKTGKTNAFGQTINASEVGTNGIVDKIYFRDRYWAVYDSLESSVKHNIKLWHNVNTNSGNYNAFSTPLQGIASVAPAYSPNADKANIALGYTVDAYSKGMVRALKLGGYDPKGKRGQTSKITTTTTNPPGVRPVNPSTSPTEAQKKRIQELQKKIAEAEALLKVSGFASGPFANITKQNLAGNKAELARLSAMAMTPMIPQTTSPATVTPQAQTAGSALERAGQTTGTQKGDMVSGYGVTSGYGQRWGKLHGGIDIGTPTGTYVGLSVPVEIVYAGNHGGYGNVIDAWAPSIGLQFRLAHLSRIMVSKGQVVAAGTALGLTGGGLNDPGRGSSTGPHLHFEVDNKKNGTTYGGLGDPSPYVQYIILSKNGPALGAQVTTPGSVTTQRNAGAISQFPSYDANGSNTIILPGQQQQQPVMMGGQSAGGIVLGGSTAAVVNSYYKKQLLGFLYKQG